MHLTVTSQPSAKILTYHGGTKLTSAVVSTPATASVAVVTAGATWSSCGGAAASSAPRWSAAAPTSSGSRRRSEAPATAAVRSAATATGRASPSAGHVCAVVYLAFALGAFVAAGPLPDPTA